MPLASPTVSLSMFAAGLFSTGQAIVIRGDATARAAREDGDLQPLLSAAFDVLLNEMPGPTVPEFKYAPEAGLAAISYLYRLSQALVDRSLIDEEVQAICATAPLPPTTADEVLSLDIALRHLPEIYRLCLAISETDPMISALERAAASFPFSSVGIPPHLPPDVMLLRRHPAIWQMYLDRIVERQDESRLIGPELCQDVRNALGLHTQLAPRLAAKLTLMDL